MATGIRRWAPADLIWLSCFNEQRAAAGPGDLIGDPTEQAHLDTRRLREGEHGVVDQPGLLHRRRNIPPGYEEPRRA